MPTGQRHCARNRSFPPGARPHPALSATPSPARFPWPYGKRSAGFFVALICCHSAPYEVLSTIKSAEDPQSVSFFCGPRGPMMQLPDRTERRPPPPHSSVLQSTLRIWGACTGHCQRQPNNWPRNSSTRTPTALEPRVRSVRRPPHASPCQIRDHRLPVPDRTTIRVNRSLRAERAKIKALRFATLFFRCRSKKCRFQVRERTSINGPRLRLEEAK